MNRQTAPLNIVQIVIVAAKLILFFVLPMIAFTVPIVGDLFGLKGLDVYRWGNFLGLLPMLVYFVMLIFTLGPLQQLSFVPALIALVVEIIIISTSADLLPVDTIKLLCMQYFPDYASTLDLTVTTAARLLLKPGIGFIINMVLTLFYGMFQFIPISNYIFGISALPMGITQQSTKGEQAGSIRKPHL